MDYKSKQWGLTLIELMVVMVVAAVLASIAYPSYQSYVRKARRSDAHTILQAAQLGQEKYRLNHTNYADTATMRTDMTAFARVCNVQGSECRSPEGHYVLTASNVGTATFTLTATPRGPQATDTECPVIEVQQTATALNYLPAAPRRCWNR